MLVKNIGCCCTTVAINCTANPQLLLLLHPFYGFFSGTTWVSRYQKGETSPDLDEARDDGFWDAVASAGPYANTLHLTADR